MFDFSFLTPTVSSAWVHHVAMLAWLVWFNIGVFCALPREWDGSRRVVVTTGMFMGTLFLAGLIRQAIGSALILNY